jgi:alpha-L-glutamate ligase-like protein
MRTHARAVLTMNQRNLRFIYPYNPRRYFPLADDKLRTKEIMQQIGVRVPATYQTYGYFYELQNLERDLAAHEDFVIKPSKGSGGGGIVVIAGRQGAYWVGPSGKRFGVGELRKHICDIIFGVYSFDLADRVIIEERVRQHAEISALSPFGLADVRVILFQDEPMFAMTRVPTRASDGRANLHQGALGIGIDLATGMTMHAILHNEPVKTHPDTGETLLGRTLPYWDGILRIARLAGQAVPLKYLGVDISIAETGPVLLEINVRPGLQIQNANLAGLRARLEAREPAL